MGDLEGKVAVVTGAGSGIGARAAELFAAAGARVVVADLAGDAAQRTADAVRAGGGEAHAVAFDLGDEDSVRSLMDQSARAYGGIDAIFNNAAATHLAGARDLPIAQADARVWDQSLHINLTGTMLCIRHGAPYLIERGGGAIVNTASGAGMAGDIGHPAYGASKAAIIRLTTYAAIEYGRQGVRVNAVSPGLIVTPSTEGTWAAGRMREIMVRQHLTGRLGTPDDIAHAAIFLCSDKASFITGQNIAVDGGLLSHAPYVADMIDLSASRTS
jgi:NAD(P)-dependent dehydrogenase (short-subunit alcohol dehydrogenase family)